MIPVVTPEEMRGFDAASEIPMATLIDRAGAVVAREALRMLGGAYGRRVTLLCGSGNNGADGRAAAIRLERRGVRVRTIEVNRYRSVPETIEECDLVIDAVVGTGFSGTFTAPNVGGAPVLAVDLPSGLDGLTGLIRVPNVALRADRTVSFAAWKPGMLFGRGPALCGEVVLADIGLPVRSSVHVLDRETVARRLPVRAMDAHKWNAAVVVFGGSAGMIGAPRLASSAALRAGSGMVRIGIPGFVNIEGGEAVGVHIPAENWANAALLQSERCRSMVLGPGLGRNRAAMTAVRAILAHADLPIVLDGDGLAALASDPFEDDNGIGTTTRTDELAIAALTPSQRAIQEANSRRTVNPSVTRTIAVPANVRNIDPAFEAASRVLQHRKLGATLLTPHDGEYERITGKPVGGDRIRAAQRLATATSAVVLLKGPTTIVASPDGRTELIAHGDQRLATAGSGDVLSGIIASLIAQGLSPFDAAATGAFIHGEAARSCADVGVIASDLIDAIAIAWQRLVRRA